MTDDVKGFRERITAAMERIAAGHSPMRIPADMTDPDIVLSDCLARIEGEASRTAAAVAAARLIGAATGCAYEGFGCFVETPIDPPCDGCIRDKMAKDAINALADRIAELDGANRYLTERLDATGDLLEQLEKAEAERDEAQRGEQEAWRQTDQMRAERDALRAQVAAETNLYKASMAEASRAIEGLTAQVKAARAKTKEEEARRVELLLLTPCASEDYKEGVRQAAAKIRSERTFTTLDAMDVAAAEG